MKSVPQSVIPDPIRDPELFPWIPASAGMTGQASEFIELPVTESVPSIEKSPATIVFPRNVSPNDFSVPEIVASRDERRSDERFSVTSKLARVAESVAKSSVGGVRSFIVIRSSLFAPESVASLPSFKLASKSVKDWDSEARLAEVEATF